MLNTARTLVCALGVAVMLGSAACGGSDGGSGGNPAGPSGDASVSGTWSGSASDSTGAGQMMWSLTQTGTSFSGSATVTDTATSVTGRGSVSGTVSGRTVSFTITIPAGGFDEPYGTCTTSVSGEATASGASMTGTYSGTSSCQNPVAGGQFTLNKQ
jgi:hypothetical protein